jgi:hypothetical protein
MHRRREDSVFGDPMIREHDGAWCVEVAESDWLHIV